MAAVHTFLLGVVKDCSSTYNKGNVIYSYNGSSLELYQNLKGRTFLYDMTSLMPLEEYSILKDEYKKFGEIENSLFSQCEATATEMHKRQIAELHMADHIVCLSERVRDSIEKFIDIDSSKISIIHHPIILKTKREDYRRKIKNILFLGRASIDKGIHYLLKFVDKYPNKNINIDVFGPVHIKDTIVNDYKGKINFLGRLSSMEVDSRLENYDLMIFPSVVGGLGMAVYEAMAHGVPVLTAENEVVADNVNGFTFEERNYDNFEKKFLEILDLSPDEMSRISDNAYNVMKEYKIETYTNQLKSLIENLTAK
jgi:glycosyltransferase involved in cell wall biosynthesis